MNLRNNIQPHRAVQSRTLVPPAFKLCAVYVHGQNIRLSAEYHTVGNIYGSFYRGDLSAKKYVSHSDIYNSAKAGAKQGPPNSMFDARKWELVDLPHDYMIQGNTKAKHTGIRFRSS